MPQTGGAKYIQLDAHVEGKILSRSLCSARTPFRQLRLGLGRFGCQLRSMCSRVLRCKAPPPHQRQGTLSCSVHCKKLEQSRGESFTGSGQFSGFQLSPERWGLSFPSQPSHARSLAMVHGSQHSSRRQVGKVCRRPSEFSDKTKSGQKGLFLELPVFLSTSTKSSPLGTTMGVQVFQSWKPSVGPVCSTTSPLGGPSRQRLTMPFDRP